MVKVKEDLTGKEFGNWKVLQQAEDHINKNGRRIAAWLCECQCEKKTIKVVIGEILKNGRSKSCGCLTKKMLSESKRKENFYDLSGEYGIGYIDNHKEVFYFDLEEYDKIKKYCWHIRNDGYIATNINGKCVKLHQFLLGKEKGKVIDHKNGDKKDNRKQNLRHVTQGINIMNRESTKLFRGCSWNKRDKRYYVTISKDGKRKHIGVFKTLEEAIEARRQAEIDILGYTLDR